MNIVGEIGLYDGECFVVVSWGGGCGYYFVVGLIWIVW